MLWGLPVRLKRSLSGAMTGSDKWRWGSLGSTRQRVDEHCALAEPAVQADEAHIGRLAAGLIDRLAVIDGGDELRADLVGELVLFDIGARDLEALKPRIFLFEFDRGELLTIAQAVFGRFLRQRRHRGERAQSRERREPHAHGRAALAFSS